MASHTVSRVANGLPAIVARHPGLAASIAEAQAEEWTQFPMPVLCAFLARVERHFPGMTISILRPYPSNRGEWSLVSFRWTAEAIVAAGLLAVELLPKAPQRISMPAGAIVRRRRGGFLEVQLRVSPDVGADDPLAFFGCASVRAGFEDSQSSRGPQSAADWKSDVGDFCEMVTSIPKALGGFGFGKRFRLDAESLARVQARTGEYLAELFREINRARVIDSKQPQPTARLRLVVDNPVRP
jgi:hypothetical protein